MNDRIKIKETQLLSDSWYLLNKVSFDYLRKDNVWETQVREVYDRGNGATILLYNPEQKTVILTRQFRIPTYLNGNTDGMLIEACAGLLEKENPEDCIRRETEEETGYVLKDVRKVFESYMSPGSVTEILHFFVAEYSKDMKISDGGGLKKEQEEIEVLEVSLDEALTMIDTGAIKDGKTIMLLQYARLKNIL